MKHHSKGTFTKAQLSFDYSDNLWESFSEIVKKFCKPFTSGSGDKWMVQWIKREKHLNFESKWYVMVMVKSKSSLF